MLICRICSSSLYSGLKCCGFSSAALPRYHLPIKQPGLSFIFSRWWFLLVSNMAVDWRKLVFYHLLSAESAKDGEEWFICKEALPKLVLLGDVINVCMHLTGTMGQKMATCRSTAHVESKRFQSRIPKVRISQRLLPRLFLFLLYLSLARL